MRVETEAMSLKEPQTGRESTRHSHTAVILAHNLKADGFGSPMPEVGALPILLRSILGAVKAGAARIVVVIDRARGSRIQHDLLQTGRLPRTLEWCEVNSGQASLPSLLGRFACELEGHLVLIAGDRTYHPSREVSIDLARGCASSASSIEELNDWLTSTCSVHCEPVPEDKWQRILTEQQRLSAEQKLDGWLVKPTDGIFARTNRRVSIPISRQIIRFPITPNMVSLFTLAVSFAAGVFFALGGYWNMLVGAILSWLSSVLDGCDGEVARLKLQESAFGCWLETICDYLYYLFIFAGMTIGLLRTSGTRAYLVWGGFLVFGAIASFLTTGLQRHRLTTGRPEQYLGVWQKEAESRSSNPFLFLGRHTEFIIRRCFLPYAFLFFALFNIINWAFVAAAVGANVVWMIALYSYLTFASARRSTLPSPAV